MEHYVYRKGKPKFVLWAADEKHLLATPDSNLILTSPFWILDCYHDDKRILHSPNDKPCIQTNGKHTYHYWFKDGVMHRWFGPAYKQFLNGKFDRDHWRFNGIYQSKEKITTIMDRLGLCHEPWRWNENEKIMFRLAI